MGAMPPAPRVRGTLLPEDEVMVRTNPDLRLASAHAAVAAPGSHAGREPHLRVDPAAFDRVAGESLLRGFGLQGLRDAVLAGIGGASTGTGWWHFWRGYALQFQGLALARPEWERAEERFGTEADAGGLEVVACALVQIVGLDNGSFTGFATRAARVPANGSGTSSFDPMALLRVGARLLVAAERHDPSDGTAGDIDTAFGALGAAIEPEMALRVATAALPVVGLTLDRARAQDFFQAGSVLADTPAVSDYGRALWHLYVAESRFVDPTWSARLHAELDTVLRLAQTAGLRTLAARAQLLRAAMELGEGKAAAGRASLDAAHRLLDPACARDYWAYHYFSSRHALLVGAPADAWEHARISLQKQLEAGQVEARTTPTLMQQAYVLVSLGRLDEAATSFAHSAQLSRGAQATPCIVHARLTHALRHWRGGVPDEARADLMAGFAQARSIELTHFFRALPGVAAELCGAALELDADPAFALKVIEARGLVCPDPGIAHWPWPNVVRTLGGFTVEHGGAPVKFGRKAPRRLLDLLRTVVALGGRHVDSGRIAAAMWPDAEGDEAAAAMKTLLHRARAVFGPTLLVVRDGLLGFDERTTWVDTWALEHVAARIEALAGFGRAAQEGGELEHRRRQLLALYRGHLFGGTDVSPLAMMLHDRLRARYIRSVDMLGQHLERSGTPAAAVPLYRAALEQDNLAEELHQRLIACHLRLGEEAQALNAYRRCRELLAMGLGLRPSARTEALVAGLPH